MSLIDFTEIPQANTGKGDQDHFELFARDFLVEIGYKIIEEPARGADGGKDLIVLEERKGVGGVSPFRWLVSCKHFAHSKKGAKGKSVTSNDEKNIFDRVKSKNCDGFIGFYSTLASESLMNSLRGFESQIAFQIYDFMKIESFIVGFSKRENLFIRNFPISYKKWKDLHYYTEPVKLFNFYIENSKYKNSTSKSLIDFIVHNSTENIIKLLKTSSSLEDLLAQLNKTLIIDSIAREFFSRPNHVTSLMKIIEEEIPMEIKRKLNIDIFPSQAMGSILNFEYDSGSLCASLVYPNHVLLVAERYEKLKEMFYDLKNILS